MSSAAAGVTPGRRTPGPAGVTWGRGRGRCALGPRRPTRNVHSRRSAQRGSRGRRRVSRPPRQRSGAAGAAVRSGAASPRRAPPGRPSVRYRRVGPARNCTGAGRFGAGRSPPPASRRVRRAADESSRWRPDGRCPPRPAAEQRGRASPARPVRRCSGAGLTRS